MSAAELEARLFVLSGADLARSFVLGERNVVGRADECEIVLSDRSISRKHALVARGPEGWFAQDLGSTNGLSQGGKRLERLALADGAEFKLGDLALRFRLVPASAEELEFAAPSAPPPQAPPPPPAAPRVAAPAPERRPAPVVEDEIELEIELDDAPAPRTAPPGAARPSEAAPVTQFQPRAARASSGLLTGELEQRPLWVRLLLVLGAAAFAAALAYGAFLAVRMLRAG